MTTIVYPYLHQLSQGEELKYSIRSVCKYAQFPFDVMIIGDRPTWYKGKCIEMPPIRGKRFTRAFDIARKIDVICGTETISKDFLYCYDDQYFVNPVKLEDLAGAVALNEITDYKEPRVGSEVWKELMNRTVSALVKNGHDTCYNYETHLPRLLNRGKLKLIIDGYDLHQQPLLFSTLYFNEYYHKPRVILEKENNIKAGIYKPLTADAIRNMCRSKLVLNHGEASYNHAMKLFLKNTFPEKCVFEL